ncbi:MAG TPA: periplasmic heavy metal sensor [Zeimonas sp.]|nr:periplasmic heavy metal sensor [Zeimonas sp.]
MNRDTLLRIVFAVSLLVNLGVLGAVGWRVLQDRPASAADDFPGLVRHLGLDEAQQRRWREAETDFLERFREGAQEIHARRDRLIEAIFAPTPDRTAIEAERAAIARLQDEQQRLVIEQLLRERELLDADQRARLRELLLRQPVGASGFERLHQER